MSKRKPLDLTKEELDKLRICADYLFFDQYKDMATFSRFEECVGNLLSSDISLETIFQEIVGPKRKYITFRRLIKAYIAYKNGEVSEDTQDFFGYIFEEVLRKDGDFIGKKLEGATKFATKEGMKKFAISKLSVVTNETKDKISGFEIYYDDFFKNDLFLSKDEDFYVSLEINLPILDSAEINQFPDANYRDGITHIFGTSSGDRITLLGFKCRSGKTSFIGVPKGKPFLFGEVKKILQSVKIEVFEGELSYFEPKFLEVQRSNPFIDKENHEINQKFLNEDKPIYEEDLLEEIEDEDEVDKQVLHALVEDDFFFDPRFKDEIEGEKYSDIKPLKSRFYHKNPGKGKKPKDFKFKNDDLVKEANEVVEKKKEDLVVRGKKKYDGRTRPLNKKLKDDKIKEYNPGDKIRGKKPEDFLLNKDNYNNLMTQIGNQIGRNFVEEKAKKDKENQDKNKNMRARGGKKKKEKTNNDKKKRQKQFFDFDDGYGFADFDDLEEYFDDMFNDFNNMGFGYFDMDFPTFPKTDKSSKISKEEEKKLKKESQENWKKIVKELNKRSPYFILKEIGAVIKALSYLKAEEEGDTSKYSMDEKVRMYEILKDNAMIIGLLSKAHQESLRRQEEEKKLEKDQEKLIEMEEEEKRRKEEEKKRIEEEIKRKKEEKRIAEEKALIEQKEKKRIEEQKRIQEEIEREKDRKRKRELEKEEKKKKEEAEKKRKEEEKKKKELEEQERRLEEEKRKEQLKREEEERRILEEEAQKKKELLELEKKESTLEKSGEETSDETIKKLSIDDLPEIEAKLAKIEQMLKKATGEKKDMLQQLYNETLKDKNAIIEALNEEQKQKIKEETDYNPLTDLRKEEEERQKLIEEENRKIEEAKKAEEEKKEQKTQQVKVSDVDIEEKTPIYRKQKLCKEGEIWNDDIFKPIKANLCPVDSYGRWNYPEDITEEDLDGWEVITWERAETIFNSKNFQVFYEGIDADDIIQGGLGDCYFLSAIAALCEYPKLVEKLFYIKEKTEEHCYGCYYRINGIWKLVLVDDYFPCYGRWGKNFAFSSTNGNELWVVLLEKAWAKLNGNYAKAIGGEPQEVFDIITNAYSDKCRVYNRDEIWNKLLESENKGYIMTAGTSGDTFNLDLEEKGLVPGHAYTISEAREIKTSKGKVKLVHLRNPWGNSEWSGDWCDSSKLWTNQLKKELGYVNVDDGSFWMSYDDFCTYFLIAGFSHLHEDYVYTFKHYGKEDTAKGPLVSKLTNSKNNNHCYISVHQKNPRIILRDGTYQKPVLHYLILVDDQSNVIGSNANNENNCTLQVTLKKGTYYLIHDINYRYVQKKQHGHNVSCYSKYSVPIEKSKENIEGVVKESLLEYAKNYLSPQSYAGGKIYQSKQKNNKENSNTFNFNFVLFDNTDGNNDVTLKDTMTFRSQKCAEFYLEKGEEKSTSLTKTIPAGDWDVFIHMPYNYSSVFSYSLQSSSKPSSKKKKDDKNKKEETVKKEEPKKTNYETEVFKQEGECIDEEETLFQYILPGKDGYYIGLENKGSAIRMKLILEGLYDPNNPDDDEISFRIGGKSKKVFFVKIDEDYDGDLTFYFDYA